MLDQEYDELYIDENNFKLGLIAARLKGKWGYIDIKGKVIVPLIYDQISRFYPEYDYLAWTIYNGNYVVVDTKGNKYSKK